MNLNIDMIYGICCTPSGNIPKHSHVEVILRWQAMIVIIGAHIHYSVDMSVLLNDITSRIALFWQK